MDGSVIAPHLVRLRRFLALAALAPFAVGMFAAPTQAITVQVQPTLDFQYVTFDAAVSGIVMTGQTLEIDFIFAGDGVALKGPSPSSIWAEIFLLTAPPDPSSAPAYSQYVVFGAASSASLLDAAGQTPMTTFIGVLLTDHGWAGMDAWDSAIPYQNSPVTGIAFDLVLPDTGETLYGGYAGIQGTSVPEPSTAVFLAFGATAVVIAHRARSMRRRKATMGD